MNHEEIINVVDDVPKLSPSTLPTTLSQQTKLVLHEPMEQMLTPLSNEVKKIAKAQTLDMTKEVSKLLFNSPDVISDALSEETHYELSQRQVNKTNYRKKVHHQRICYMVKPSKSSNCYSLL